MTRSLRVRLSLAIIGLLAVVLGTFSLGLYAAFSRALWHLFDERLMDETHALATMLKANDGGWEFHYRPLPDFDTTDRPAYFEIWQSDGTVAARSVALGTHDLPRADRNGTTAMLQLPDGRAGRAIRSTISVEHRLLDGVDTGAPAAPTVVVARDTEDIEATLSDLRVWLWSFGLFTMIVAAGAATITVSRGLRPAARLGEAIARMDEGDLGEPIVIAGLPTELEAPVTKLNQLLERLGESFARERRFTADVSHELRTPLAGLRTILEVAASRDRAAADYRHAIGECSAIVQQMHAMVENLLMLARVDAKLVEVVRERIILRALVDDVWNGFAARAADRSLVFFNEIAPGAFAVSDRDKLRVIVSNLLSNAVEYTAEGGRIVARSGDRDGFPLEFVDSGPPIPETILPRIFDRFVRADAARSGGLHCGIGLALAKTLSSMLDLSLTASNHGDGTVSFRLAPVTSERG